MTQSMLPPDPTADTPLPILQGDVVCPHCGCLDLRQYADELPICPHCGAVLDAAPLGPESWLEQWPAHRRSGLANLFYHVVRRGETAPPAIVAQVTEELHRRLRWATDADKREWWCQVLSTIREAPEPAQTYAASVVATEALPAAERDARKQERAKPYALASMKGKPATEKQHSLLRTLLRSKGDSGELPSDRAEASAMIDKLLREGEAL